MTFLNPILAGVGLAAVTLPIIIHILMRRRRKPVMWAAMKFLLEAYRQHRKRIMLEQILLLASRCLLVALIGLALGRPILGAAGALGGRGAVTLYILIDNSLAASALDENGKPALERHKSAAGALLAQMDAAAGDRVSVISLGGPARGVVDPPSSDAGAVGEVVKGLGTTDSPADIPGALNVVASGLSSKDSGGSRPVVAVLSDFLTGSADTENKLEALGKAEGGIVVLASNPSGAGATNVSILGIDPERPVVISRGGGGASQARIALRRSGPGVKDAAATTVRLGVQAESAGGRTSPATAGQVVVRWQPGQTETVATASVDLGAAVKAAGSGPAILSATIDTDAVEGDNTWRRPIEITRTLRVGLVAPRRLAGTKPGVQQFEPADWVRLALEPTEGGRSDGDAELVEIEPLTLDAARLSGLDAAVIVRPEALPDGAWRRLRAFTDQGGFVLVFAAPGAAVPLWADAMARDMGLPWTVGREARAWPDGVAMSVDRAGDLGLLSVIAPELPELAAPVRVFKALSVENAGQGLLKTADGASLVVSASPGLKGEGTAGRGLVAMVTVAMSFEWTDLQAKPLMVPLMWELVKQGVGAARGSWSALAGQVPATPARSVELRSPEGTVKIVHGRAETAIRDAGVWRALDEQGTLRGLVAINADPVGGRTDAQPRSSIASWLGVAAGNEIKWIEGGEGISGRTSVTEALSRTVDATRFVLPLLLAALGVALLELAMARWFSHAGKGSGKGGSSA
jgi:hypothetical protein